MSKEAIFDFDIERIEKEKIKDVMLMAFSINLENYSKLAQILGNSFQLENISINMTDGNNKFWNNFFKIFMPEAGQFTINPEKIELFGDVEKFDCDIYQYIQRLQLKAESIKSFKQIEEKFPNLREFSLAERCISKRNVPEDITNIFSLANYFKNLSFAESVDVQRFREELEENGLDKKFILSEDGLCFINTERLGEKSEKPANLRISARDMDKIDIEKLKISGDEVTLVINHAGELSNEELQTYVDAGINIQGVSIYSPENEREQNEPYDVQTFYAIRDKLDELVEGIDINSPEKERFAEVYRRVCSNITYDTPAAYPMTNAQKEYSEAQETDCRNLKNGLLQGDCVCAGYADILRNALAMVNIESKYIVGQVGKSDGLHAWNKVKLDGNWYNSDPTWDATRIRMGKTPTHALQTDEEIKKKSQKSEFEGPECVTEVDSKEIDRIFDSKHLYIGGLKIPSFSDISANIKLIGEVYTGIGITAQNMLINLKERLESTLGKEKILRLNTTNSKSKNEQDKSNSWDLNNWGINSDEFRKETKSITENTNENSIQKGNGKDISNEK